MHQVLHISIGVVDSVSEINWSMTWYSKTQWVLLNVNNATSLIITLAYWTLIASSKFPSLHTLIASSNISVRLYWTLIALSKCQSLLTFITSSRFPSLTLPWIKVNVHPYLPSLLQVGVHCYWTYNDSSNCPSYITLIASIKCISLLIFIAFFKYPSHWTLVTSSMCL